MPVRLGCVLTLRCCCLLAALIPAVDPWFGETRSAFPASLGTNSSLLLFWLDLFVAPATPAGNYSAAVTVSFGDSVAPVSVPLQLRVFGFALDSTSKVYKSTYGVSSTGILMAAYGKDWRQHTDETVNMTQRYMQLGLMHRLSFTHGGIPDPALGESPVDWVVGRSMAAHTRLLWQTRSDKIARGRGSSRDGANTSGTVSTYPSAFRTQPSQPSRSPPPRRSMQSCE